MNNSDFIANKFYFFTKIPLEKRKTNRLEDNTVRKNFIFNHLAEVVFDHPKILKILKKIITRWLDRNDSESTLALAGYIYYLDNNFEKAKNFFLKIIENNPDNLDNWFDLAFCLYHCKENKLNNLGKAIIFNFDSFIKYYKKNYEKCDIKALGNIYKYIQKNKLSYFYNWHKYINKHDLKIISGKRI